VNHIVLFTLVDAGEAEAFIEANDRTLPRIPAVEAYFSGRHLPTGRAVVKDDYDVCVYLGFPSEEAYEAYLEHELHRDLVAAWRDRIETMRVYDVLVEDDD
jgi:hypothetical protein